MQKNYCRGVKVNRLVHQYRTHRELRLTEKMICDSKFAIKINMSLTAYLSELEKVYASHDLHLAPRIT